MRTCTNCNANSPDTALNCVNCKSDLSQFSSTAVALKNFIENPRVSHVKIQTSGDACPLCYEARGTFSKDKVPSLPHEGCSHQHGCRCMYIPILTDIFP